MDFQVTSLEMNSSKVWNLSELTPLSLLVLRFETKPNNEEPGFFFNPPSCKEISENISAFIFHHKAFELFMFELVVIVLYTHNSTGLLMESTGRVGRKFIKAKSKNPFS